MKISSLLTFKDFYSSIEDKKMPLKTAYKFNKIMRQVEDGIDFYTKRFNQIADEYGVKEDGHFVFSEDGNSIKIVPGKEKECEENMATLDDFEIDIDNVRFDFSELEDLDLTVGQMDILMPLIND